MSDPGPIAPLLLVGCGRMGGALLAGWNTDGLSPSLIVDPGPVGGGTGDHRVVQDAAELPHDFRPSAVILAVKPQLADAAMAAIADRVDGSVVLSIMAGRRLAGLRQALPAASGIVRAMPNMPASIGRGISVALAEPVVDAASRALCDRLLRAVGSVGWIEDETLLDPVTAVSGSGPAYVFLLAELLETAARSHGLPPALARQLARETISGAGAMLAASSEDAADLRRAVTSPGGTTQAALSVLMADPAWPRSVQDAVQAATDRSRTLGG